MYSFLLTARVKLSSSICVHVKVTQLYNHTHSVPILVEVLLGHTHALLGVRVRKHPWKLLHKL